jgi:hypothetical protein
MKSNLLTMRLAENLDLQSLGCLYLLENGINPREKVHSVTWGRYRAVLRSHGFEPDEILKQANAVK